PFIPLLPYLEQQPLYTQGYATLPIFSYDTPGSPGATPLSVLACPSDSGIPSPPTVQWASAGAYYGVTSYRGNAGGLSTIDPDVGTDGVIVLANGPVKIVNIKDGTSNTLLFGEFSNFEPNWPDYGNLLGFPDLPFNVLTSPWNGEGMASQFNVG